MAKKSLNYCRNTLGRFKIALSGVRKFNTFCNPDRNSSSDKILPTSVSKSVVHFEWPALHQTCIGHGAVAVNAAFQATRVREFPCRCLANDF